jgi:hypothetical protein
MEMLYREPKETLFGEKINELAYFWIYRFFLKSKTEFLKVFQNRFPFLFF